MLNLKLALIAVALVVLAVARPLSNKLVRSLLAPDVIHPIDDANNEKGWTVAQERALPTPLAWAVDQSNNEKGWTVRALPTPI
ncbi:hypothetical protein B0H19DRAFT_1120469 [Mycena capillaripes]|nr:hypothetical protein B0H19DRAFT_1120469 [Mycena capillaripes]